MAKKHQNYTPQKRNPRQRAVEMIHVNEIEKPPLASYEYLADALGVREDWLSDSAAGSLGGYTCAKLLVADRIATYGSSDDSKSKELMLYAAKSLQYTDGLLLSAGYDLGENPSLFINMNRVMKQSTLQDVMDVLVAVTEDDENKERAALVYTSMLTIVGVFTSNAKSARIALEEHDARDVSSLMDTYIDNDDEAFTDEQIDTLNTLSRARLVAVNENPSRARSYAAELLLKLRNPEVIAFIESELNALSGIHASEIEEQRPEFFGAQEVDFTILPTGTNLREYTQAIYEKLTETERSYADIKRIEVLESIREVMGAERCYYVHGVPRSHSDSEADVQKNYIGLVLQNHDQAGCVISEDAIAVSPLAKKDAGYLFRSDYSTGSSWRDTLSLPKESARSKGARQLKFTEVRGRDKYEAYTQKAIELLTCPAYQFGPTFELYYSEKNGEYCLKERKKTELGRLAIEAASRS